MRKTHKKESESLIKNQKETPIYKSVSTGIDCLVWQTSASVLIPG